MDWQLGLAFLQALLNLVVFKRIAVGAVLFFATLSIGSFCETVESGTFQVRQMPVTGATSAKMTPGVWPQLFGDIVTWPKAETVFFTLDPPPGEADDQRIEVRFNDGALGRVSGNVRAVLPTCRKQAVELADKHGYGSFAELERELIVPVVRSALRLSANLMSARESYAEKRADFEIWAWDQIQHGPYETEETTETLVDPVSGQELTGTVRRIRRAADGTPIHRPNPLQGLGITLAHFEIGLVDYEEGVRLILEAQQRLTVARLNRQAAFERRAK